MTFSPANDIILTEQGKENPSNQKGIYMYYLFVENWAGTKAIFDNKNDCMRFVKDFKKTIIERDEEGFCPVEGEDYDVYEIKTMNPHYEEWEKEKD